MPPKSILDKLLERIKNIPNDDTLYIIVYTTKERRPPKDFYNYIRRLQKIAEIEKPASGVLVCRGLRTALIVQTLIKKYCGKSVATFKAERISLCSLE